MHSNGSRFASKDMRPSTKRNALFSSASSLQGTSCINLLGNKQADQKLTGKRRV